MGINYLLLSRLVPQHHLGFVVVRVLVHVVVVVAVIEVIGILDELSLAVGAAVLPEEVLPDVPARSGTLLSADKVAGGQQSSGFCLLRISRITFKITLFCKLRRSSYVPSFILYFGLRLRFTLYGTDRRKEHPG